MASLISNTQAPTSLMSNTSSSMITFGRKQVKHKSNKVTPQDLDANINKCGLPSYSSPTHEKPVQTQNDEKNKFWTNKQEPDKVHLQEELKNNIFHTSTEKARRPEWPKGSIPRTVKKLSWDDEHVEHDRECPTAVLDAGVALTPLDNKRLPGDVVHLQSIS